MLQQLHQTIMSEFAKYQSVPTFSFEVVMNNLNNSNFQRTDPILRIKFDSKADAKLFVKKILSKHNMYSLANPSSFKPVAMILPHFCIHLEQKEVDQYCNINKLSTFTLVIRNVYKPPVANDQLLINQSNNNNQTPTKTSTSIGFNNFLKSGQIIDVNSNLSAIDIFKLNISQLEQFVQSVISNNQAIVKVLSISKYDTELSFLLDQIKNPTKHRPSRALHYGNRWARKGVMVSKMNPLTGVEIKNYKIGSGRENKLKKNSSHTYDHTAKTSVTCLPSKPEAMNLYNLHGYDDITFMWDINSCDKKKHTYSWKKNVISNSLFYLNCDQASWNWMVHKEPEKKSVHIDEIIKSNKAIVKAYKPRQNLANWNELLYGLPKGRIDAIGISYYSVKNVDIQSYQLGRRLTSLNIMYFVKKKLNYTNYEPAMFILEPGVKFEFYHHPNRLNDLINAFHDQDQDAICLLQGVSGDYALFKNIIQSALNANIQIDKKILLELKKIVQSQYINNIVLPDTLMIFKLIKKNVGKYFSININTMI